MPDLPPPDNQPKVSVLMITYNHEKYIAQAIESVLMQETDFRYELIVGEDCSTDGTGEIVREYGRKHPDIVHAHLRERNIGARQNLRRIFAAARGKYIALLEGDDYWTSPQKLQTQVDLLDAHPETSLCGHRSVWHYEDGARPDMIPSENPGGFYDLADILERNLFHTGSVMFRHVIEAAPDWHAPLYMGDLPLFVTLAQYGNICLLPESMAVYRLHGGGVWTGIDDVRKERANQQMFQAFYDNLDPKYRPLLRKKLFECSFNLGLASFTALQPDLTRKCLRECLKLSGALEFIPQKLLLALKGYCWWAFVVWRRVRHPLRSHARGFEDPTNIEDAR